MIEIIDKSDMEQWEVESFYTDIQRSTNPVFPETIRKKQLAIIPENKEKTYGQDWAAYNEAQMREKIYLINILNELMENIPFPEKVQGRGRQPIPLKEKIFYLTLQAYNIKSSRRCIADLELCKQLGYIKHTPHFNTVLNCLKDPALEVYFKHLINVSGLPLQEVESDFAIDSSGFSTKMYKRWFDHKWGKETSKLRIWKKAHLTCGVKTNIITAVTITSGNVADTKLFQPLLKETSKVYEIREVSADKAYSSRVNLQAVSEMGGIAFIPFKKISVYPMKERMLSLDIYNLFQLYPCYN